MGLLLGFILGGLIVWCMYLTECIVDLQAEVERTTRDFADVDHNFGVLKDNLGMRFESESNETSERRRNL